MNVSDENMSNNHPSIASTCQFTWIYVFFILNLCFSNI